LCRRLGCEATAGAAASERHLAGGSDILRPGCGALAGDQPPLAIELDDVDRGRVALGARERVLVKRFMRAWDAVDVDGLVALLSENALMTMLVSGPIARRAQPTRLPCKSQRLDSAPHRRRAERSRPVA
jgi:hypothetical protein